MIKVKCIRQGRNYYSDDIEAVFPLSVLTIFLTSDFLSFSDSFKEWVLSDSDGTGGNVTYLDKEDGNIVLTLSFAVYETDVPFIATQKDFLEILNTWQKLYDEGWPEIIITQDDSGVHLEGKNR